MFKIGSHVSMSGKEMFLSSAKEAVSYGANTLMVYTGAPQNTRRKKIQELKIDAAWEYLHANEIEEIVIHAPYIINLANTVKRETFDLAVEFLALELERSEAMESHVLVLHPGSHVGAGSKAGIEQIVKGLNEVLTADTKCNIALETMAGKGSEIGKTFEELKAIIEGVEKKERIGVCLDTCHIHDAGYDLDHFDAVLKEFDQVIGLSRLLCVHVNDSKNERGSHKDRHENIGFGKIGFANLLNVIYHKKLENIPKILETPYVDRLYPPYREEIRMIKEKKFDPDLLQKIKNV